MRRYGNQRRPAGGAGRGVFTSHVDPDPNNPYATTFKVGYRAKVMGKNLLIQRYPFVAPQIISRNGSYITIRDGNHEKEVMVEKEYDREFATLTQDGDGGEKSFKLLPLKAQSFT
jgi:hypothetical protein